MSFWNRNPLEKRMFVKPGTNEPAEKLVQGHDGEVIGRASTPEEEARLHQENEQQWQDAA